MEILRILIPIFFGIVPVGMAIRNQLRAKKQWKEYMKKTETFRYVRGKVLEIEKKSNTTGNARALNLFLIKYEFEDPDGRKYSDTYKHVSRGELSMKELAIHYDPERPENHLLELEIAACEKQIKDSYTMFYCGILTTIFLIISLNFLY